MIIVKARQILSAFLLRRVAGAIGCLALATLLEAQSTPQFAPLQRFSNNEILFRLNASTGMVYRIETSTSLPDWKSLLTIRGTGSNQYTDSAAPYYPSRFYRATELSGTNFLTGDHLITTNGDVVIHPINHASFVMSWNGKMIYNDPVGAATLYAGFPKADLILVSHSHTDHFSASTLNSVTNVNAVIIAPQAVFNGLSAALKGIAIVLTNGASTNVMGLNVESIRAYNSYHSIGTGNGYVVNIGGKRIYMSGDTGNIPEMRALTNIDVAFLCMNQPYTMTATDATNAVSAFRPGVVYPYHYQDQSGSLANATIFKQRLRSDLGIEVRLRKWY
jgi:L-ascorbate metabolism protein UlaG (beta-lactamase superfamily)